MWDLILINPLINLLFAFNAFLGNLGFSVISLSFFLRLLLFPLSLPMLSSMRKQAQIAPKLSELQKKYKDDKQKLAVAQMELFRKEGVNPFSGCLPMILQIAVLIALYQVLRQVLFAQEIDNLNQRFYFSFLEQETLPDNTFFYLNLSQKDPYFLLAFLAGAFQFADSFLRQKKVFAKNLKALYNNLRGKKDSSEAPSLGMGSAQGVVMLFYLPLLTFIFGATLPSGLVLYWATSVGFSLVSFLTLERWLIKPK